MFASQELVERIERAEVDLLDAGARAIAARRGVPGVLRPIAGGIAAFTVEGSPLNKVAGLGFAGVPDESELASIEAAFAAHGAALQVEIATLADPAVGVFLCRRGYVLQGVENVLGRALDRDLVLPEIAPGLELEQLSDGEQPRWVDVLVDGFLVPDQQGVASHVTFQREVLEPVIADFSTVPQMRRYWVRRDGEVAGGASVRYTDGIAQMCGAATLPAHRRRGVQTALLVRRLRDAREAGCDLATITTQPGSKSMENAQARGFDLLYTRLVFSREPDASPSAD